MFHMKKPELKFIPLSSLIYLRRNPQYMTPHEMDALKISIKRDGFLAPILVRPAKAGKFELLSGNHRAMAAAECGMTEIPAIVAKLNNKQAQRVAVNLNTVHGDPTAELLAPFLAEIDPDILSTVHLDDDLRKAVIELDGSMAEALKKLDAPQSWNHDSIRSNIKRCVCPTCGKSHISGSDRANDGVQAGEDDS